MGHFRGLKRPPNCKICHIFPFFGQIRAWNMSAWPLMARNRFGALKRHQKKILHITYLQKLAKLAPKMNQFSIQFNKNVGLHIAAHYGILWHTTVHNDAQQSTTAHNSAQWRTTVHYGAQQCSTALYSLLRPTILFRWLKTRNAPLKSCRSCCCILLCLKLISNIAKS